MFFLNRNMATKDNSPVARIISPSGVTSPEHIEGAAEVLRSWGYVVTEGRYARASEGRFAGTDEQRLSDLQQALDDPSIDLILCSRGGYGLVRIIDKLNFEGFATHPKWVLGFSDTTILHAALNRQGFPTVHGHMARYLSELPGDDASVVYLRDIFLNNRMPVYQWSLSNGNLPGQTDEKHLSGSDNNRPGPGKDAQLDISHYNRPGIAEGILVGGNLSVLMGLRGTHYEPDYKGSILFIEDIAEQAYHIDRMMQNLRISGVLEQLSGLVVGHFTDCPEDESMGKSILQIILDAVEGYHYPVCLGFPAGHEHPNFPLVLGTKVKLTVTKKEFKLDLS